ncbi:MAG: hypothetical protein ACREUE_03960 [Panacagrimonas sp.]
MTRRADFDLVSNPEGGDASMGSGRQDVQRLFGHFGLDPADYVVSFARPADVVSAPVASEQSFAQADACASAERDLLDYRNFELTR